MPRSTDGAGLRRDRRVAVVRGIGFGIAVALGAVAVWLIVTSSSLKSMRIGALAGFWGLLLGAYSVFGSRHAHPAAAEQQSGQQLAVRENAALERAEEAAARRQFELRLEHMLRREIQAAVAREVSTVRAELASLRGELLEKVGGQLRLERIETTRVIGSDIEALQREVNQLKTMRQLNERAAASLARLGGPGRVVDAEISAPGRGEQHEPVDQRQPAQQPHIRLAPAPPADAAPPPAAAPGPLRPPAPAAPPPSTPPPSTPPPTTPPRAPAAPAASATAAASVTAAAAASAAARQGMPQQHAETQQAQAQQAQAPQQADPPSETDAQPKADTQQPAQQPSSGVSLPADEFAGLPRLRPFTDFELDPIEPPAPSYSGRRRADEPVGRHGARDDEPGGRRRGDAGHDVLAQILQREAAR